MFKGDRIIVPRKLQDKMIERIHAGHLGVDKSKTHARDLLFWPGMGKHIKAAVEACSICQECHNVNPKEPMISYNIPDRPSNWHGPIHMEQLGLHRHRGFLQPVL